MRWLNNRINQHNEWWLPAGKHTKNYGNHHVNRKINYTWQFSIAMLNYQRVAMATTPPPCVVTLLLRYSPFQHPSLRRSMLANHVTDYREENSISVHHFNVFHDEGLLTMKKCHLYPFITHGFAPYSLLTPDIFWKTTVLRRYLCASLRRGLLSEVPNMAGLVRTSEALLGGPQTQGVEPGSLLVSVCMLIWIMELLNWFVRGL